MVRLRRVVVTALAALPLLGMGSLGGGGNTPERDYRAKLVDRDGIAVEIGWLSLGGDMALSGEYGRGNLRIALDDIDEISFAAAGDGDLVARAKLRRGEDVEIRVRSSMRVSGRTALGQYRIRARDLQSIELLRE